MENDKTARWFPWVDMMKMLGLFSLVYGHLFSYGYAYVFAFNVPVFFILSGFLFKEDQPGPVFWRKLWNQLVLPMLCIGLFYNAYLILNDALHHRLALSRFWFPIGMLAGEQSCLATGWFIYTLVLLKILSRYVKGNLFRILLALVFLAVAYWVAPAIQSHEMQNAILAVPLSYPFFVMGHLVKSSRVTEKTVPWWGCLAGTLLSAIILFLTVRANGPVFIYTFTYGNSLFLCLLGGMAGTCLLYFVSRFFERPVKWIKTISVGAVLVMGYHIYPILFYRYFVNKNPLDVFAAVAILLLFIPITRFCVRYVPWVVGNRK